MEVNIRNGEITLSESEKKYLVNLAKDNMDFVVIDGELYTKVDHATFERTDYKHVLACLVANRFFETSYPFQETHYKIAANVVEALKAEKLRQCYCSRCGA